MKYIYVAIDSEDKSVRVYRTRQGALRNELRRLGDFRMTVHRVLKSGIDYSTVWAQQKIEILKREVLS